MTTVESQWQIFYKQVFSDVPEDDDAVIHLKACWYSAYMDAIVTLPEISGGEVRAMIGEVRDHVKKHIEWMKAREEDKIGEDL